MTTRCLIFLSPRYLLNDGEQATLAVTTQYHSHSVAEVFYLRWREFGKFEEVHLRIEVVRDELAFQLLQEIGEEELRHVIAIFLAELREVVVTNLRTNRQIYAR